jgi:hypothetical protein
MEGWLSALQMYGILDQNALCVRDAVTCVPRLWCPGK